MQGTIVLRTPTHRALNSPSCPANAPCPIAVPARAHQQHSGTARTSPCCSTLAEAGACCAATDALSASDYAFLHASYSRKATSAVCESASHTTAASRDIHRLIHNFLCNCARLMLCRPSQSLGEFPPTCPSQRILLIAIVAKIWAMC